MKYNFDEIIDRKGTNSMNIDGFRQYIFHDDGTMKFPYKDEEFIRMWVADMEFSTPPEIIEAMKQRLDKKIFGYTKVFDPKFYEAFKNWTEKKYGWSCEKKDLVTSPGIIPALYELTDYICKPDEKVLILTPSYSFFKHAVDYNHLELVCSDLINEDGYYTIDFDDFDKKAKDEKVKLCIFCNPHNPSGRVWSEEELIKVGNICKENNVWLISDEIHCDILRNNQKHIPFAKLFPDNDRIITCMATTKTFNMAGLMFSSIIIPNKSLMNIWHERHFESDNPLSIAAAQAAYMYCEDWLEQFKVYLDNNFKFTEEYLKENLPKAIFKIPEATYLAWVNISAYVNKNENLPLLFAKKAGVLLEGGNMFVQNSEGFIRLNLACPRKTLEEGLKRICGLLNK